VQHCRNSYESDSDSDDTDNILEQCPRRKQPEQASKGGGGRGGGGSSRNDQSTPRLSLLFVNNSNFGGNYRFGWRLQCSNNLEDTSNIEKRKKVLVQLDFPPGAVGLHLAFIGTEAPYVKKEVKPYCPLCNFLIGGEILLSINGTEVADTPYKT
jgi:hypothetical protein